MERKKEIGKMYINSILSEKFCQIKIIEHDF